MTSQLHIEDSFRQLVDSYSDKVVNTCYGFVHQKEDAEDIAQDVFVEVYKSYHTFKQEAKISTWIYRIAVNKSLDFIKRKNAKKRIAYLQSLFNREDEALPIADENMTNIEEDLASQEHKKALQKAMAKLPENQKIAITLNKFESLPSKEVAKIMDISLSSAESLIHRAKNNLKKYLYHYYKNNMQ